MEIEDRLKLYASYADISRRWTAIMDSKGAFLSALNGGVLAFQWGSLKIEAWHGVERYLCIAGTGASLLALVSALLVITPREKLSMLVGKKSPWTQEYKPMSFYGYIARRYGANGLRDMVNEFRSLDEEAFAYEALEQHFNISMVIQRKSGWVFRAGVFTLSSLVCIGAGIFIRIL